MPEIHLTHCTLIDVRTGRTIEEAVIRCEKGRILAAGKDVGAIPKGAEVFDLKGKYVIPGLINAHCHMTLPSASYIGPNEFLSMFRQLRLQFTQTIASGVTTVRDMGAFPRLLHHYIRQVKRGSLTGPRVVFCNAFINVKGGYVDMDWGDLDPLARPMVKLFGPISAGIDNPAELRKKLRRNSRKARFIKLSSLDNKSLTAGKRDLDLRVYSDADLAYIFDFAQKKALPVAAHTMSAAGFTRALKYPFHSLEHIVADTVLADDHIQTIADKRIAIIPTMVIGNIYAMDEAFETLPDAYRTDFIENEIKIRRAYWDGISGRDADPSIHKTNVRALGWFKRENYDWKAMLRKRKFTVDPTPFFGMLTNGRENLKKMKAAGVMIGCGTDSGVPMNYHGTLYREMEFLARLGFSNLEVLQAATLVNAKILCLEDQIGALEPGKAADIVVLNTNPLTDITAYRRPAMVFKDGRLQAQNDAAAPTSCIML